MLRNVPIFICNNSLIIYLFVICKQGLLIYSHVRKLISYGEKQHAEVMSKVK